MKNKGPSSKDRYFDEFMDDIETEVRLEKYKVLWQKYGKLISAGVTVFLGGIVALQLWLRYDANRKEEFTKEFVSAQNIAENGDTERALSMLRFLAEKKCGSLSSLAQMYYAGLLSKSDNSDNTEQQAKAFQKVFQNKKTPLYVKDLARILYVNTTLQGQDFTEDLGKELLAILSQCSLKEDGFFLLRKEFEGLILFKLKKYIEAREAFNIISRHEKTSEGMRRRISLMIQAIQSRLDDAGQPVQYSQDKE